MATDSPAGYPAVVVAGQAVGLSLFVSGDKANDRPVEPLHRHRVRVLAPAGKKPRPQVYADPRSEKWEDDVAEQVLAQLKSTPTQGAGGDFTLPLGDMRVLLTLRFNLPKPVSYPARIIHHTRKPDLDNYAKAVIDGLVKGRVIVDDGLITDLRLQKRYIEPGHPEGVEIDLTALPAEVP